MNNKFLEQFYEAVVLPRYAKAITFEEVTWSSHGKLGLDSWSHHFASGGKQYVLLYEDFPDGAPFNDGLSHEVVKLGDEFSIQLKFTDDRDQIDNILGWYTLYRELNR